MREREGDLQSGRIPLRIAPRRIDGLEVHLVRARRVEPVVHREVPPDRTLFEHRAEIVRASCPPLNRIWAGELGK